MTAPTLTELQDRVARDLRDPVHKTFTTDELTDLINEAIAEVSRLKPLEMRETVNTVDDVFDYEPSRITEPMRLEVWTTSAPIKRVRTIPYQPDEFVNESDVGFEMWNGLIHLPYDIVTFLNGTGYTLELWGYAPRLRLNSGSDVAELDDDTEWAVRECATYHGYDRLVASRALYTQWQANANNSDVSFAGLLGAMNAASQKWERRRRQLQVARRPV